MKQVILKSLTLCNFKGEHNRTTTFNADVTTIAGANGLGKSRHFDAFLWLLFGKDKENRADFEVKTRDAAGNTTPQIDVVVTGVIEVNGEPITLTRKLVENWVKPRMSQEQVFKGNETKCFWNDVPVSVTEYTKRVGGIMDEQLFKMITNPFFFVSLNWKMQREQLFAMAGEINESEIIAKSDDFRNLVDKLTGKSLADYKLEISAKKTNIRRELAEIQPRIDQTEAMKPESYDWDSLSAEIDACNAEIKKIDDRIGELNRISNDRIAAANAKFEETRQMRNKLYDCIRNMDDIVNKAVTAENNRVRELNADRENKIAERANLERKLNLTQDRVAAIGNEINAAKSNIASIESKIGGKRQEWIDTDASTFTGNTTCPVCGQPLPESMIEESRKKFADEKQKRLEQIESEGGNMSRELEKYQSKIAELETERAACKDDADDIAKEIERLDSIISGIKIVAPSPIDPTSLPDWVKAKNEHDELKRKIDGMNQSDQQNTADDAATRDEIQACNDAKKQHVIKRDELIKKSSNRDMIDKADKAIEALTEKGRTLSQEIADIERDEYIIGQYTKAKVDLLESRVAGLFKIVKFKMFDYTIDGNIVETCVATVDGKPFPTCNSANQVNAGLDIINALCTYYGIHAPIFIDNRESVINLIPTDSQIINLVVTHDEELKIY